MRLSIWCRNYLNSRKMLIIVGVAITVSVVVLFSFQYASNDLILTKPQTKSNVGQIIDTVGEPDMPSGQKSPSSLNFDIPQFAKFEGSGDTKLNLVEFGDYQCPFCKKFFDETEPQIIVEYVHSGKAKYYFLDVSILGPDSRTLSQGSWCADEQDKYYEYHDYVYANQGQENSGWGTPDRVKSMAKNISGLDSEKFNACLDSKKYESRSQLLTEFAYSIGLTGTPTMYVGNSESGYTKITGALPYKSFKQTIEAYLK